MRETPGTTPEKQLDVLAEMIPAAGHGLVGASYEFLDNSAQADGTASYFLEDVDLYGVGTRQGPAVSDDDEGKASSPTKAPRAVGLR